MGLDDYYFKIFLMLLLGFSIAMLVMKCCCNQQCFKRSNTIEHHRHDNFVYVISDENFDEGSLSSVTVLALPEYDAIVHDIPPPPYSKWKVSGQDHDEELPAYAAIVEQRDA